MMRGAELGVLHGSFARDTLQRWPSATEYWLVDLWSPQDNYEDLANADQTIQDSRMRDAIANTEPWKEKIRVCRNFTTACAQTAPNEYFDYVYIDARHDRKGVLDDMYAWWPKVKSDGLVCGCDARFRDAAMRN